jgi:hypothetical protein
MSLLSIALKEWQFACEQILAGKLDVLIRKGGLYEPTGEFELEHRRFFLFPTTIHQRLDWLKPAHHAEVRLDRAEPDTITIEGFCDVVDVAEIGTVEQLPENDERHPWTQAYFAARLAYRPDRPLLMVRVRAFRLAVPVVVPNKPHYIGCRSWLTLDDPIDIRHARQIESRA